ncbi:ribonuclease T2 family protein [Solimonas marina]|uniref:Uncharacterized protein n=1 Tax=Solimonas marina TaxID=2714601 RepID=A0A969WAK1_9GAMM|nr:hypothetical protein [Solimonas marina]NKF23412.1 hypothetical protein [Solimonas marina]
MTTTPRQARHPLLAALCGALLAASCSSQSITAGASPGRFDYWVLTLSWLPEFCKNNLAEDMCQRGDESGFFVYGLAPKNEHGDSPEDCGPRLARVDDAVIDDMQALMLDHRRIQHEWRQHGSCSGLDQRAYFDTIDRARRQLEIPSSFDRTDEQAVTTRSALLDALQQTNPRFERNDFALNCAGHWLREVKICYGRDMQPHECLAEVEDDCDGKIKLRARSSYN